MRKLHRSFGRLEATQFLFERTDSGGRREKANVTFKGSEVDEIFSVQSKRRHLVADRFSRAGRSFSDGVTYSD